MRSISESNSGDAPPAPDARLDRLWDATRPPSPPPAAFDTLWAEVERAAGSAPLRTRRSPFRHRWAIAAAGLAQAAALLVAALVLDRPTPRTEPRPPAPVALTKTVEIDEGQIAIISGDGPGDRIVDASPGSAVAPDLDLLNEFESMATL